jgi:hypothetical protein
MRRILLGFACAAMAACASTSDSADSASDITNVTPPPPVQQSIGNCWVFATNAWIESMSARPVGGTAVDLSEAMVSYLYWLDQITTPPTPGGPELFTLQPTGSWGLAADLLSRFGWMTEADFLSTTNPGPFADRHAKAFAAIQHEIDHGKLQTPESRADRQLVGEMLAKAWDLEPAVITDLVHAFGPKYDRTFLNDQATIAGTKIHKLSEITIGYSKHTAVTAQDVVGQLAPGEVAFDGVRVGPFAYSDVKPPGSEDKVRGYMRRVQQSLLQDLPVVMSETQDDVDLDAHGVYRKPASGVLSDQWYGHAVTVFDLSVQTADYGILPAGVVETRPAALAESLEDASTILTFRARNSYWGRYADGSAIPWAGGTAVTDYALDYLLWRPNFAGGRILMRMTLPNDPTVVIQKSP